MTFWAAGAAIVGSVGGALISSSAAGKAADTQAASSDKAIGEQQREYDLARNDLAPYRNEGGAALGDLASGIFNGDPTFNFDPSKVQLDPGYQFGLKQGQQAIDRKTAAAGGRISGASLKAAAQYGTDYGTQQYGTAYNRQYGAAVDTYNRQNSARSDRLNRLAALAGIGQTATAQTTNAGQVATQNIGNLQTAQGNASAAGQLAQGNIWSNAGNQIAALYGRNSGGAMGPTQTYNPSGYSSTGGDFYYGAGQNYGV